MKYTSTLLALAAAASAHMHLEYPPRFTVADNGPLDPSGSNYPCKIPSGGAYTASGGVTEWNAGETKTISFTGSAVHGGGSCQFSLTTDTEPTKDSQFKVIHSVIGGCPSNATGNLSPEDPEGHGASTFPVTLPKDLPSGQYTFAWSWLNKIGNREFYMECAPIQVGGGGGGDASTKDVSAALGSLPDMFVANMPESQCATTAEQDFVYPDPGQSVVEGALAAQGNDLKDNGCAQQTVMGAGAGNMGSPAQPTGGQGGATSAAGNQPAPTSAAEPYQPSGAVPTAAPSAAPSNPGGVFAPGASSAAQAPEAPAETAFSTLVVTQTGGQAEPTGVAPPVAPSQPAGTGVGPAPPATSGNCVPCTNDGGVVCIGSSQFGLCNFGCAVPQELALGMTCSNGSISRRSIRAPRAHLHRRHGSRMI